MSNWTITHRMESLAVVRRHVPHGILGHHITMSSFQRRVLLRCHRHHAKRELAPVSRFLGGPQAELRVDEWRRRAERHGVRRGGVQRGGLICRRVVLTSDEEEPRFVSAVVWLGSVALTEPMPLKRVIVVDKCDARLREASVDGVDGTSYLVV